jgi:hypothetical protein
MRSLPVGYLCETGETKRLEFAKRIFILLSFPFFRTSRRYAHQQTKAGKVMAGKVISSTQRASVTSYFVPPPTRNTNRKKQLAKQSLCFGGRRMLLRMRNHCSTSLVFLSSFVSQPTTPHGSESLHLTRLSRGSRKGGVERSHHQVSLKVPITRKTKGEKRRTNGRRLTAKQRHGRGGAVKVLRSRFWRHATRRADFGIDDERRVRILYSRRTAGGHEQWHRRRAARSQLGGRSVLDVLVRGGPSAP